MCYCSDPPDLIATLPNGERWGVEVTRAYQQVRLPGKDELASSEALFTNLQRWSEAIGEKTVVMRARGYSLFLGPGALSLRDEKPPLFDQKWKEDSERVICDHIESGENEYSQTSWLMVQAGRTGKALDSWRIPRWQRSHLLGNSFDAVQDAVVQGSHGSRLEWHL